MEQTLSFYKKIFTSASIGMVVCDESGQCIEANEAVGKIIGGTRKDVLSQNYHSMKSWEGTGLYESILVAVESKKNQSKEVTITTSFGRSVTLDFHIIPFDVEGRDYLLFLIYDVTPRKQAEDKLDKYRGQLEDMVAHRTEELKQKTVELEEANTALKVILKQRENDKMEFEHTILYNVEKFVSPHIEKLKQKIAELEEFSYLEVIESNLKEIFSLFSPDLNGRLSNLTPAEIQIADLIRTGKTTKEIAQLLNLSPTTIATHRQNIRKKLSITNKKTNLRTTLSANQK